jgi:hypothetical protein
MASVPGLNLRSLPWTIVCAILTEISFLNCFETHRFALKKTTNQIMFQQYIGDGANIFIAIVAVLIGFATALGYVDFLKTKKEQEKKD